MNKPKAVLFDLDDTLLAFNNASDCAWEECCDDFIRNNTVSFTSRELLERLFKIRKWYWSDPFRNKKGRNDMKNARREVFGYTLRDIGFYDNEKIIETADSYTRLQETLWDLFDGTTDALQTLKNLNIRMAVVTNGTSDVQRGKLARFGITQFFDHIIIDTEVGASKPDVKIFQIALDKLTLDPSQVWMIGDNLVWDVEGPQRLGIFSVWNDFKREGLPENSAIIPDKTVCSVAELAAYIDTL
jgi:putative hydrolase of the HAD superfamily